MRTGSDHSLRDPAGVGAIDVGRAEYADPDAAICAIAARQYGVVSRNQRGSLIDVSGPRSLRPRTGIRLHRVNHFPPQEIEWKHGLPVTSPSRTLLDLASSGDTELENVLARAERRRLVTPPTLEAMLARHHGAPGSRRLRALLSCGPALTRSEAERRFLNLLRKAGIPRPAANTIVEGIEVDFLWRGHRLVVEIDGFSCHADRHTFENDRRRDGILAAAGFRVIRFIWRQLTATPEIVLVCLSRALARGRARRPAAAPHHPIKAG